jgi:hypothetical protein
MTHRELCIKIGSCVPSLHRESTLIAAFGQKRLDEINRKSGEEILNLLKIVPFIFAVGVLLGFLNPFQ